MSSSTRWSGSGPGPKVRERDELEAPRARRRLCLVLGSRRVLCTPDDTQPLLRPVGPLALPPAVLALEFRSFTSSVDLLEFVPKIVWQSLREFGVLLDPPVTLPFEVQLLLIPVPADRGTLLGFGKDVRYGRVERVALADQGRRDLHLRLVNAGAARTLVGHVCEPLVDVDRLLVAGIELLFLFNGLACGLLPAEEPPVADRVYEPGDLGEIHLLASGDHLARHVRLVLVIGGARQPQHRPGPHSPVRAQPLYNLGLHVDHPIELGSVPVDGFAQFPDHVPSVAVARDPRGPKRQASQGIFDILRLVLEVLGVDVGVDVFDAGEIVLGVLPALLISGFMIWYTPRPGRSSALTHWSTAAGSSLLKNFANPSPLRTGKLTRYGMELPREK
jgi:hypothetical protein